MSQAVRKILVLLPVIGILALLQSCEDASSTSGGGGSTAQVVDLNKNESSAGQDSSTDSAGSLADNQAEASAANETQSVAAIESAATPAEATATADPASTNPAVEPAVAAAAVEARTRPRGEFHILIDQSHMACHSCGLNFDSAELVIDHTAGRFEHHQTGGLHIKLGPYRQARFQANLSSIPLDAEIIKATLHMRLNQHEGLANADNTSEFVVKGYVNGSLIQIKTFSIKDDIKGRGYSKGMNPVVPFDYTRYARML